MNVEEFKQKYMDEEYGEVYGDDVTCVYDGPDEVNHKTVYQTSVYKVVSGDVEQWFEVTNSRSNSGYWSDSERYDPEVREVKAVKKVVEITEWVGA
jgi:hypothetical protein